MILILQLQSPPDLFIQHFNTYQLHTHTHHHTAKHNIIPIILQDVPNLSPILVFKQAKQCHGPRYYSHFKTLNYIASLFIYDFDSSLSLRSLDMNTGISKFISVSVMHFSSLSISSDHIHVFCCQGQWFLQSDNNSPAMEDNCLWLLV